jgi:hypothetical protein
MRACSAKGMGRLTSDDQGALNLHTLLLLVESVLGLEETSTDH